MSNKEKSWVDFKEIKEKVSMKQVLNFYGILDDFVQKGDELVGCCPIHKGDNKNAFHINTEKNVWHCFTQCDRGGNVIDFIACMEQIEFREAALKLKELFLSDDEVIKPLKKKKIKRQRKKLAKEENIPLSFTLKLNPNHEYLKMRGLNDKTIEYFGLGYADMGIMKERIAIPIHNEKGELIAYAGRILADESITESDPKYKLPRGFKKSLIVFNLHRASKEAKDKGLIIVEGFFDTFRLHQAGFPNVVALMGSSMSDKQEELILKSVGHNGKVTLIFDNDDAGRKATKKVARKLLTKVYVKIVRLGKEGSQPDKLSEEQIRKLLA